MMDVLGKTQVGAQRRLGSADSMRGELVALLFRHDPIHISYETNCEDYEPEALRILARLSDCLGPEDVCQIVYQEFVRSFGREAVGAREQYEQLGLDAWGLWQQFACESE